MNKIINVWILWFQGINSDDLPLLNKECINAWESLNKNNLNFRINFLDEAKLYLLLPEIRKIFNNSIHERTLQAKSDLARLMLLNKYGGVWVDSSVFPVYPISYFYSKLLNKQEFFSYRFLPPIKDEKGVRVIPSWFLISSCPEHYVISAWLKKLKNIFLGNNIWEYFQIHYSFSDLYYSDKKFADFIDNMVQESEENPHSIITKG